MLCTVVYCRATNDLYRVGAEFTCSLDSRSTTPAASNPADLARIRNSILD